MSEEQLEITSRSDDGSGGDDGEVLLFCEQYYARYRYRLEIDLRNWGRYLVPLSDEAAVELALLTYDTDNEFLPGVAEVQAQIDFIEDLGGISPISTYKSYSQLPKQDDNYISFKKYKYAVKYELTSFVSGKPLENEEVITAYEDPDEVFGDTFFPDKPNYVLNARYDFDFDKLGTNLPKMEGIRGDSYCLAEIFGAAFEVPTIPKIYRLYRQCCGMFGEGSIDEDDDLIHWVEQHSETNIDDHTWCNPKLRALRGYDDRELYAAEDSIIEKDFWRRAYQLPPYGQNPFSIDDLHETSLQQYRDPPKNAREVQQLRNPKAPKAKAKNTRGANPPSTALGINKNKTRQGIEWEDGIEQSMDMIAQQSPVIRAAELANDNLPPFYVKLSDNQVGHLLAARLINRVRLSGNLLNKYWPADFDTNASLRKSRTRLGERFQSESEDDNVLPSVIERQLRGGELGISDPRAQGQYRRTFLSSGCRMIQDPAYSQAQPALDVDTNTAALPGPESASGSLKRKISQLEQDTATKDQQLSAKEQELAAARKELEAKAAELAMQSSAFKRARRAPPDLNSPSRSLGTVDVPEVQAELEKAKRALEQERKASGKELESKQKVELELEQERGNTLRAKQKYEREVKQLEEASRSVSELKSTIAELRKRNETLEQDNAFFKTKVWQDTQMVAEVTALLDSSQKFGSVVAQEQEKLMDKWNLKKTALSASGENGGKDFKFTLPNAVDDTRFGFFQNFFRKMAGDFDWRKFVNEDKKAMLQSSWDKIPLSASGMPPNELLHLCEGLVEAREHALAEDDIVDTPEVAAMIQENIEKLREQVESDKAKQRQAAVNKADQLRKRSEQYQIVTGKLGIDYNTAKELYDGVYKRFSNELKTSRRTAFPQVGELAATWYADRDVVTEGPDINVKDAIYRRLVACGCRFENILPHVLVVSRIFEWMRSANQPSKLLLQEPLLKGPMEKAAQDYIGTCTDIPADQITRRGTELLTRLQNVLRVHEQQEQNAVALVTLYAPTELEGFKTQPGWYESPLLAAQNLVDASRVLANSQVLCDFYPELKPSHEQDAEAQALEEANARKIKDLLHAVKVAALRDNRSATETLVEAQNSDTGAVLKKFLDYYLKVYDSDKWTPPEGQDAREWRVDQARMLTEKASQSVGTQKDPFVELSKDRVSASTQQRQWVLRTFSDIPSKNQFTDGRVAAVLAELNKRCHELDQSQDAAKAAIYAHFKLWRDKYRPRSMRSNAAGVPIQLPEWIKGFGDPETGEVYED